MVLRSQFWCLAHLYIFFEGIILHIYDTEIYVIPQRTSVVSEYRESETPTGVTGARARMPTHGFTLYSPLYAHTTDKINYRASLMLGPLGVARGGAARAG